MIAIREERGRNEQGKKKNLREGHKRYPNKNIIAVIPSGHYMYHQIYKKKNPRFAHTVYLSFVRISEQTSIISLYSISWLAIVTETECLLRGTGRVSEV